MGLFLTAISEDLFIEMLFVNCLQSCTDRIVFKLFGKNPSNFPLLLRSQVLSCDMKLLQKFTAMFLFSVFDLHSLLCFRFSTGYPTVPQR